jgi:hypothetical protein
MLLLCAGTLSLTASACAFPDINSFKTPSTVLTSSVINSSSHRYEIFISGGAAFPWLNNIAPVAMTSTITNTYYVQAERRVGAVAGGGILRVFTPKHGLHVTLGPAAYYVDFDKIHGVEFPFSNSGAFDTLNYQFLASGAALFLESRVIFSASCWHPFLVLGAGNAWNHLSAYDETPTDSASSASPTAAFFRNNTMSSFAYEAGVGVSHQLSVDIKRDITYSYALEYHYFNFGAGKFAQSSLQTGDQALGVKTLHANAILLSLSAAFR